MTDQRNRLPAAWRLVAVGLVLLGGLIGTASCSSVPDAVNPVEWYRGAEGWFESDEDQQNRQVERTARETAPPLPGANKDYPNLSTVPERPKSVSTVDERARIERGLAADRENARYAEPEPDRPSGAVVGAPTAAPRTPVTRTPAPAMSDQPMSDMPEPPAAPSGAPDQRSSLESAEPVAEQGSIEPASYNPPLAAQPQRAAAPAPRATMPAAPAAASAVARGAPSQPDLSPMPAAQPTTQVAQASQAVQSDATPDPAYGATQSAAIRDLENGPTIGNWPSRSVENLPRAFLIYFGGGATGLDTADRGTLREVIRIYKNRGGPVQIVGHSSSQARGGALNRQLTNFRLSSQRAETVARELQRMGMARADMVISAVSDSEPLYGESTPLGEAGNRRVEVFFTP